jgi:ElaB/YqjD/DUF883 family membrane-anchored ribosome-binding protein
MAPFGLFKKKDKFQEPSAVQPGPSPFQGGSLSIQEAQKLLQETEMSNIRALSSRLLPIKSSAEQSLKAIGVLAAEMEHEKIKLEGLEQRFKSLVETSRKAIVVTLKREATVEFELPESVNDVRKFREKFEALMKRFGEVTGSHSKILNNFMKKQSSRMREELESLDEFLAQTKAAVSEFEQGRSPIVRCGEILNTTSQKVESIGVTGASIDTAQKEVSALQEEIGRMTSELQNLKSSDEYHAAESLAQARKKAEAQRDDLRNGMLEIFSHLSRAFTKYSYGVSRETEDRLGLMSSEPWKLLDMQDISEYMSLLSEIKKSISSGKVQLKDSDKMVHYIDVIAQSMPEFQARATLLREEFSALRNQDSSALDRASELEQRIAESTGQVARTKDGIEMQQRQNEERKAEVSALLAEAAELLTLVTGHTYSVHT